jgi:hypothetical protein
MEKLSVYKIPNLPIGYSYKKAHRKPRDDDTMNK